MSATAGVVTDAPDSREATRRPAATGPRPAATFNRVTSLDGLRGLAAIVVVIHHSVLALPLADDALDGPATIGTVAWWLTYSPLHIFWAGEEAVLVFFVLSGFVLALPATNRAVRWRAYYVKRLLRLYLPVWGSLVLAMALAAATRTAPSASRSDYVNDRADVPLGEAPVDALLVAGAGLLNGPLWSLQWEMIFSLLLPAYLLLAHPRFSRGHRAILPLLIAGILGLIALGTLLGSGALRFLPMFAIGVLMAFHQDVLATARDRLSDTPRPRLAWGSLAAATIVLLTGRWIVEGLPWQSRALEAAAGGGSFVGACLALFLAMHWRVGRELLQRRSWQWLGTVSFSLYIVHEPIVVSTALLLPADVARWATPVIALPVALLVAAAFFRLVEAPAHALAKSVGDSVSRR